MVSPLKAKHPRNGEVFKAGTIYVAPPDNHMLLEENRVLITRGPKENRFRPSVDALFRSAAYTFGPRVIGVVLSGYLDDGTSGLWSVKRLGGLVVVQDPANAAFPAMPSNALEYVEADHVIPIAELSALLVKLTEEKAPSRPKISKDDIDRIQTEFSIARKDGAFELGIIGKGELTAYTCPDCHGAMTKLIEGNLIRFRCHTGHAYTINSLLAEVSRSVENMLYMAMRGLEETNMLLMHLAEHFNKAGKPEIANIFIKKSETVGAQAQVVHDSILQHETLSGDIQFRKEPEE